MDCSSCKQQGRLYCAHQAENDTSLRETRRFRLVDNPMKHRVLIPEEQLASWLQPEKDPFPQEKTAVFELVRRKSGFVLKAVKPLASNE